jgi:hypothetical protein
LGSRCRVVALTAPLPIACTLTAEELPARLDEIRVVSHDALRSKHRDGPRAVMRFDPTPGIRDRLAAIVAAEATCCAFLRMTLAVDDPDAITLTIEAPAEAVPVLEELLTSFELVSA